MTSPPRHLLVAGCGYVGTELALIAHRLGWQVTGWTYSEESARELQKVGIPSSLCDLSDPDSVNRAASSIGTPAAIVHCASSGRGGAEAYEAVYHQGMRNLAEAFQHSHLVFTSSTSVYAQTDGSEVDETSETKPPRETGRLLLKAEEVALDAGGSVVRLAGIYGPGRSVLIKRLLAEEATLDGDGDKHINQIHRDDAAAALWHVAGNPLRREIFNASDSAPMTQREIYQKLCGVLKRPLPPSMPPDLNRKRGWTDKRVSNAKLLNAGWQPAFPVFIDWAANVLRGQQEP